MSFSQDNLKNLNNFIEKFLFNENIELLFFIHQLNNNKSTIELCYDKVNDYYKTFKLFKKVMAKSNVQTNSNIKKILEQNKEYENKYNKMVIQLSETHHFIVTLLKINNLHEKNIENVNLLETFKSLPGSVSELIDMSLQINSNEKALFNKFNRIRNILIHSPRGIIKEYLNDNILVELLGLIKLLISEINLILDRLVNFITVIAIEYNKMIKNRNLYSIITLKEFAKNENILIDDLIKIVKNVNIGLTQNIEPNMIIDNDCIVKINKFLENKRNEDKEQERNERIRIFYSKLRIGKSVKLVFDFEYLHSKLNSNEMIFNFIYEIFYEIKLDNIYIINNNNNRNTLKTIEDLARILNCDNQNVFVVAEYKNLFSIFLMQEDMDELIIFCGEHEQLNNFKLPIYYIGLTPESSLENTNRNYLEHTQLIFSGTTLIDLNII